MDTVTRVPDMKPPSFDEIDEISKRLKLKLSKSELQEYCEVLSEGSKDLAVLDDIAEAETTPLPVKYPRDGGHKPLPKDNPNNGWFWKVNIKGALEGKLKGKKLAIKDNILVAGVPCSAGCKVLQGLVPDMDATVVTRILEEGGEILGKSNCCELLMVAYSHLSGSGPVPNATDPTRDAGGTSSGSAVLVALDQVDMALGTDQGGSVRQPAAWNGIVGLKPSRGLIPYTGSFTWTGCAYYDTIGPMTKTVEDCALLLEVLAGSNGIDHRQPRDLQVPMYTKEIDIKDIGGTRVGILTEGFGFPGPQSDSRVDELVKSRVQQLTPKGAVVNEISVPYHRIAKNIRYAIFTADEATILTDQPDYFASDFLSTLDKTLRDRLDETTANTKKIVFEYEYFRKYHNKYYFKGQNLRRILCQQLDDAFQKVDVLVYPTLPFIAPKLRSAETASVKDCVFLGEPHLSVNNWTANMCGLPAISVNAGFVDGMPVGMSIMGRLFDEVTVLRVAKMIENLTG